MKKLLCLVISILVAGSASAATVTIDTSLNSLNSPADNQGWWSDFYTNNNSTNDNYFTGDYVSSKMRSYFSFDLSSLSGVATSATFEARRYGQVGDLTLGIYDVSTPAAELALRNVLRNDIFIDLGTGVSYGSFSVAYGGSFDVLSFQLNTAAIADINAIIGSGYFSIGAAVIGDGAIFSASSSEPGNGGPGYIQRLVLEVDDAATIPEPGTMLLLGSGLVGIAGYGRKKSRG